MNVVENNRAFDIFRYEIKGKYNANKPHALPNNYSINFKRKKYKYQIFIYQFKKKKNPKINLLVSVATVENYSLISISYDRELKYKELIDNGIKPIYIFSTKFPWFPKVLLDSKLQTKSSKLAFNPFITDTFGFKDDIDIYEKYYKENIEFFFQFTRLEKFIPKEDFVFKKIPSFFYSKIIGEKTFFNIIFKEVYDQQSRPLTLFTHGNILIDKTPLSNFINFYEFFDKFKDFAEELDLPQIFNFKNYIKKAINYLDQSQNIFTEFKKKLIIKDLFNSYSEIINSLKILELDFLSIYWKIEDQKLIPKKGIITEEDVEP